MKSKFITSGIPSASSCSITPAKLHLRHEGGGVSIQRHAARAQISGVLDKAPLNFRHRHGDKAVKLLLGVEAIAPARVLPAGSASSLPRLGFRNPLHRQDLQAAAWEKTKHQPQGDGL